MITLQFADTHNLVVFLAKPTESEGFEQIVDFMNAHTIKYALTVNPTIYTSCIEQFWATVKVKTVNGEQQLQALVDGRKIVVPQSSVPSDPTNVADEAVNEEPSMQLKELMDFCTKLQQRVLDLENTKTAQAQEITSLKKRDNKLEKKKGSRTHKLKRLYKVGRSARVVSSDEASLGDQEDASKQGRKIHDIDADEDITLENVHDAEMFDVNDLHGDEVFVEKEIPIKEVSVVGKVNTASIATTVSAATITEDEITLAQALAELKSVKPKVTTVTTTTTKGILLQEPSDSTTTTTTIPSKDKGKGIMVEEPLKMKKKDQINFDEQESIRLQAEFNKEVRLAREKYKANVALIEEWNDVQAKIETDYELAQRLQADEQEELTVNEKATPFQQLLEKRRKHFNMARWKPKDLKSKSFANIQELFDKAFKRVITFVDFRTELVEGTEMEESSKKAEEAAKMKELMKIIPDEEEVAVNAIPLATKPTSIMLRSFNREYLETLWKLVKAKHGYTRPEEGYERVLWGDLKTMFEHHVEDAM
ncbi:hypothetical protein Tco_0478067 [Tanacetum coccineum]